MRDLLWSVFDRGLPVFCFIGGAWFRGRIAKANAEIELALRSIRHD